MLFFSSTTSLDQKDEEGKGQNELKRVVRDPSNQNVGLRKASVTTTGVAWHAGDAGRSNA